MASSQWYDEKEKAIKKIFDNAYHQFFRWIEGVKPTGEFSLIINVNQGGVRGKPQITRKEDLE